MVILGTDSTGQPFPTALCDFQSTISTQQSNANNEITENVWQDVKVRCSKIQVKSTRYYAYISDLQTIPEIRHWEVFFYAGLHVTNVNAPKSPQNRKTPLYSCTEYS
ncbi:hypothetical protein M8J76_009005 [Diaphorina citri]|nr:hypothetical protein M8J76_009005 [Diaphorina citri]